MAIPGALAPEATRAVSPSAAQGSTAAPRIAKPPNPRAEQWARVRAEAAAKYGPGLFGLYLHQDDLLATRGMHRTSPWWLATIGSFFVSRDVLRSLCWILAIVGRGGGKSTTLERLAIVVMLFAQRDIPPTEAWQWPFISVRTDDATRRIHEIAKMLRLAYGLDVKPNSQNVLATEDSWGHAVEFVSMAGTIGNVSGPSTAGCTVDEAGKMRTQGAAPDAEIIISLAETSRARANWVGVRCSSAWLMRGAHYGAVTQGPNAVNFVATIGVEFIDLALAGFEEVAIFEAAQGNKEAAAQIRAWSRTLHASSPYVPTWVANNSIGALASRMLLETLPREPGDEDTPIHKLFLRENGSMSLAGDGGPDFAAQCLFAARVAARVTEARSGRAQTAAPGLMKVPSAQMGDPRHPGAKWGGGGLGGGGLSKRRVF